MQIVQGMAYLHECNVVHFDLKPDNLLLDGLLQPHGFVGQASVPCVKVADFGLSKEKRQSYVSGVRDLRGTLPFMAPELVNDPDRVTEKADVWSMGMLMWVSSSALVLCRATLPLVSGDGQIMPALVASAIWRKAQLAPSDKHATGPAVDSSCCGLQELLTLCSPFQDMAPQVIIAGLTVRSLPIICIKHLRCSFEGSLHST